ncbi:MerR family transcriptional regulator [Lysinibacillus sp. 3P01SB]|uniref:MerR family transcriptional regulator n=1 Tax=Lysinibacillus sp. 3P01SB TaxID=3132284 RepID=UPI0039A4AD96
MEEQVRYLTIGEMSKITNLPIRTLHYYDQIDLFKPLHVDSVTNYRYYSESQIYKLDLIKSLKYIGTPLEHIKIAQALTPEQLHEFLAEQEQIVEKKVKRMLEVQQTLLKTKKLLEEQINIPAYNKVYEMEVASQRLLAIKPKDVNILDVPGEYFSSLIKTVEREGSVMNSRYGGIYPLKSYARVEEIYYDYFFTPLLTERYLELLNKDVEVLRMPAGKYACIAFEFDETAYFKAYKQLEAYVKYPQSAVYEVFMPINYSSEEQSSYVVELKVKIF